MVFSGAGVVESGQVLSMPIVEYPLKNANTGGVSNAQTFAPATVTTGVVGVGGVDTNLQKNIMIGGAVILLILLLK